LAETELVCDDEELGTEQLICPLRVDPA